MEKMTINVYAKDGTITKTATARTVDITFGTIRSLMEVLKVEDMTDTAQILKRVFGAWDELTGILGQAFPDIAEDEWSGVKLAELVPVLLQILKWSFAEMLTIPTEDAGKN